MMSRTDNFRLGRSFRNVESVSWELKLFSIHGKNFFNYFGPVYLEVIFSLTQFTLKHIFSLLPHSRSLKLSVLDHV